MSGAPELERDFNSALDDILLAEEKQEQESYEEGVVAGRREGNPEGYHLGYHRGAELGAELGYYLGVVTYHLSLHDSSRAQRSEKICAQLRKVRESIEQFPRGNSEAHDLLGQAEVIRAQYKKACALLKVEARYPRAMESLRRRADRVTRYLTPLLPLANCHTVEFLSGALWERLVPHGLRAEVERRPLPDTLELFWRAADGAGDVAAAPELAAFVSSARAHGLCVDGEACLSADQARERIERWGGCVERAEEMTQFVSPKKGHEVAEMLWLVSALSDAARGSHCVELGGGKGYLGEALARRGGMRALTVDCDEAALGGGRRRAEKMQRLLPTPMRQPARGGADATGRHRYANQFVDARTDLRTLVEGAFPEDAAGVELRLLLTGLHTCGDLGPDSLRLFAGDAAVAALCNVPCCYHLLTEPAAGGGGEGGGGAGYPMSRYLRGHRLGRNARMLAAQSLERAAAARAGPSVGLLYRAMLQVLLKERLPDAAIPEGRLRGVAAKCQSFEQYFKIAVERLRLGSELRTAPAGLEEKYTRHWKSLVVFYLLRLCLAQVVEGLVLLDRLLFLLESGFGEDRVFVVRLFEAARSPRCHGIVALRLKYAITHNGRRTSSCGDEPAENNKYAIITQYEFG